MLLLYHSLALYLACTPSTLAHASPDPDPAPAQPSRAPCTARSPTSGAFFDLSPLHIPPPSDSNAKVPRTYSWNTTGFDYGYNFTLNFCGPVLEDVKKGDGVEGLSGEEAGELGAFYRREGGEVVSLGRWSEWPVLRGRKLVVNYTGGSPCGEDEGRKARGLLDGREIVDGDDDDDGDDDEDDKKKKGGKKGKSGDGKKPPPRRKSTLISMLCDRDPLAPTLALSFVGTDPDHCAYFFEARSSAACAGIEQAQQTLSPGGVFGVIVGIAILVYVVGGCVYSRVVLQQRGWRQLPNYAVWAGLVGFVWDLLVILASSCARCLPGGRRGGGGYSRVNGGLGGSGRGRGRDSSDAENRLIDELNEEWDD